MSLKRIHLIISGQVQGVCFRAAARQMARELGLTGWVKNLPTGQVELVAESVDETRLKAMVSWARQGPELAQVTGVQEAWSQTTGGFKDFQIVY